jgi:hypothetical protein
LKIRTFEIIVIISTLGIIAWIISDYYGGMIIYLLMYGYIIFPIMIAYFFTSIMTVSKCVKNGIGENKISVFFHSLAFFAIVANMIINSDLVKGKTILSATLRDDTFHYNLNLREDNECELVAMGLFGYKETYQGKYQIKKDTIIFSKKPYENDFIPNRLLIDKEQEAIFINSDENGNFETEKIWLNHFEIIK